MSKFFRKQIISATLAETWDFFSYPGNLQKITPQATGFKITSFDGKKIYEGQEIQYDIHLLPFLRVKWISRITEVRDQREFVDVQISGPCHRWHHRHLFKPLDAHRTEMIDAIHYQLPFGALGHLSGYALVNKKLHDIFNDRRERIKAYFPGT